MSLSAAQWLGVDESHLVCVPDNPPHRLTMAAAQAFVRLQQAAARDGIHLAIASSYRNFARQLLIWNGKYLSQRRVHDDAGNTLEMSQLTATQKLAAILRFSALPGTSRHHWGTDLDVYAPDRLPTGQSLQLEPWEYATTGYFAPLTAWLDNNLQRFGFFRPFTTGQAVAAEPWHISFQEEATTIIANLDYSALQQQLENSSIAGKEDILVQLPVLWQRYVMSHTDDIS